MWTVCGRGPTRRHAAVHGRIVRRPRRRSGLGFGNQRATGERQRWSPRAADDGTRFPLPSGHTSDHSTTHKRGSQGSTAPAARLYALAAVPSDLPDLTVLPSLPSGVRCVTRFGDFAARLCLLYASFTQKLTLVYPALLSLRAVSWSPLVLYASR